MSSKSGTVTRKALQETPGGSVSSDQVLAFVIAVVFKARTAKGYVNVMYWYMSN